MDEKSNPLLRRGFVYQTACFSVLFSYGQIRFPWATRMNTTRYGPNKHNRYGGVYFTGFYKTRKMLAGLTGRKKFLGRRIQTDRNGFAVGLKTIGGFYTRRMKRERRSWLILDFGWFSCDTDFGTKTYWTVFKDNWSGFVLRQGIGFIDIAINQLLPQNYSRRLCLASAEPPDFAA